MSVSDWVNILGLAISVFATAWMLIEAWLGRRRALLIAGTIALVAGLFVTVAYSVQVTSRKQVYDTLREDALALLNRGSPYFWTFNDLLDTEQQQHPALANKMALGPILQAVLEDLAEEHRIKDPLRLWYDGPQQERHCTTVYCQNCKVAAC